MRRDRVVMITGVVAVTAVMVTVIAVVVILLFADESLHGGEEMEAPANGAKERNEVPLDATQPVRPPTPPDPSGGD